ncbi:FTR1 family protein [sulfur-oxidizing endosymbiont of Gigantopelta aegis]|uniref:FTR1 family protein n=1 Tax=sulfur-oxidizing endosymbiont of Gigantopelta aegis TaxID=2794934 RepID=UPI0018DE0FC7|nr:FTR1 family protein [sulfur-oxidizing endosymbiont of Gigantopelta aegis]
MKVLMRPITLIAIFCLLISKVAYSDTQQLLQLIDYVGVDYGAAVTEGQITNPGEYGEMIDFATGISQHANDLPEHAIKPSIIEGSQQLTQLIKDKESAVKIKQLGAKMHLNIINAYQITVIPRKKPSLKQAKPLYAQHCASCHGATGMGDGVAAADMSPPPIDFTDIERYQQRTLYGLYSTITQGVHETAMQGYSEKLNPQERWSLAFYVGNMAAPAEPVEIDNSPLLDIATLTTLTPEKAKADYGVEGEKIMAFLRHHPEVFYNDKSGLAFARTRLDDALTAYKNNETKKAYKYAVEAYLEGFELVEQNISAFDKSLKLTIEVSMTELRNKIRTGVDVAIIESDIEQIYQHLDIADELLGSRSLSGGAAFASAFFILLREGLEALLIVAALAAFLVKTKRKDGLIFIHIGWISALLLGGLTWWASMSLFNISGASREITEGVAAIVAMIILLYVGFWMHDKSSAAKWKTFIDGNMKKALSSGTLWTLTGLSFIAVYREVFETILFYQALWMQTSVDGKSMALSGVLAAIAVLVLAAWFIMRYSVRLPLRQFFSITGGLMFVLAIVFAGKGIAALQEAGLIISSPVNFIRIDLLGIYPNLQGLLFQLALIIIAAILWNKKSAGIPAEEQAS